MLVNGYTKFILTIIALGLMLNAFNPWLIPAKIEAASYDDLKGVQGGLEYIADAIRNYRPICKGK